MPPSASRGSSRSRSRSRSSSRSGSSRSASGSSYSSRSGTPKSSAKASPTSAQSPARAAATRLDEEPRLTLADADEAGRPSTGGDAPNGGGSESAAVRKLKQANEDLRKKLMQLNSKLDFELARREKSEPASAAVAASVGRRQVTEAKYQKLRAHVEELRREVELVQLQAHHAAEGAGAAGKVSEMQNLILAREHEIAQLKDNNRALEMLHRGRSKHMEAVSQIESEMSRVRSAHTEELRVLKERLRHLKEGKEQDDRNIKRVQAQLNQIQDKIVVAAALKQAGETRSLAELEALSEQKEKLMEELRAQLADLTKQGEGDRRRACPKVTQKEVEALRRTHLRLKEELAERQAEIAREEKALSTHRRSAPAAVPSAPAPPPQSRPDASSPKAKPKPTAATATTAAPPKAAAST
eukprot:RCo032878